MPKINLQPQIQGNNLYLRPVRINDASLIRKWHNDPEIMKLARVGEEKISLKQEKRDIAVAIKSNNQAYHLILTQPDNTPIGFLRINYIDKHSGNVWLRMTIGDKKTQGKGYGYEAINLYLKWLFNKLRIHRVTLECYSTNTRAIRFYKKVGFKKEGVLREAVLINDKFRDIISFGILEKDFTNKHPIK